MDREQISERAAVDQDPNPGLALRGAVSVAEIRRELHSREALLRRVREMMKAELPAMP